MNDDSPLKLQGITKNYQEFHLGPIDLEVPRGYVMGLVGADRPRCRASRERGGAPDRQESRWRGPRPAALALQLAGS